MLFSFHIWKPQLQLSSSEKVNLLQDITLEISCWSVSYLFLDTLAGEIICHPLHVLLVTEAPKSEFLTDPFVIASFTVSEPAGKKH